MNQTCDNWISISFQEYEFLSWKPCQGDSLNLSDHRRAFPLLYSLILSLEIRVPSIDIYHRIRNPSMDEKVELKYRLRWLSQGSISKVPQSMVDASLELYPIPYSMLKLLCLSEHKNKVGPLGSYAKPEKKNMLPSLSLEVTLVSSLGYFFKGIADSSAEWAFDSVKWRPILPEYSAVASIVRNASDHLRPFLMMDPPATLEALVWNSADGSITRFCSVLQLAVCSLSLSLLDGKIRIVKAFPPREVQTSSERN
nr:peptidase S10, serine carboxypeptidase, alpha/beta hydrolase fold protein [Tanacetum cinerariifolium]